MSTINLLLPALWETLYMVFVSSLIASVVGIPLGLVLFTTRKDGILEQIWLNRILGLLVNALRSVPFIILLVAMIPLTRFIVGTTIGTLAAMVPLTVGAIPFVARIVENALTEVPAGLIEAGLSMGASAKQIMWKILIPEALPSIINGLTVTVVAIVSFSAMAGAVGGGGLGDLGIRYGYQRFDVTVMLATVAVLIAMVQMIQWVGDYFSRLCNKNVVAEQSRWSKRWGFVAILALCGVFFLPTVIQHVTSNPQQVIKVGSIAGPETELMKTAAQVMRQQYGVDVKVIVFSDYVMPNEALNNGDIDANYFQHVPYLASQCKARGYQLSAIGKIFVYPVGIYSNERKQIDDLKTGDKIAIPNDPSNGARALLLLQKAGLIRLRHGLSVNASVPDIISNPKKLQIIELDAAQLPRSLNDVAAAVINTTYAKAAGLHLSAAIFAEASDSPYANVVVTRSVDTKRRELLQLVKALRSQRVQEKAKQLFGDGVARGWTE